MNSWWTKTRRHEEPRKHRWAPDGLWDWASWWRPPCRPQARLAAGLRPCRRSRSRPRRASASGWSRWWRPGAPGTWLTNLNTSSRFGLHGLYSLTTLTNNQTHLKRKKKHDGTILIIYWELGTCDYFKNCDKVQFSHPKVTLIKKKSMCTNLVISNFNLERVGTWLWCIIFLATKSSTRRPSISLQKIARSTWYMQQKKCRTKAVVGLVIRTGPDRRSDRKNREPGTTTVRFT